MAHYIFNLVGGDVSQATGLLRARMWGISAEEPHRDALAPGDFALVYLAAPERKCIGRAELVSVVHDWTPSEEQVYPGDSVMTSRATGSSTLFRGRSRPPWAAA